MDRATYCSTFVILLLHLFAISYCQDVSSIRALHEFSVEVDTLCKIENPLGVESGYFMDSYGIFISSFSAPSLFFMSLDGLQTFQNGTSFSEVLSMNIRNLTSDHTDCHPARMCYDYDSKRLFLTCRSSHTIMAFDTDLITLTTMTSSNEDVILIGMNSTELNRNLPIYDMQMIQNKELFVTDSFIVSRITSSTGYFKDVINNAVITHYKSISKYFQDHGYTLGYKDGSLIQSIAPDSHKQKLYVAVAGARNFIFVVGFEAYDESSYSTIRVLVGDTSKYWGGFGSGDAFPIARNGNAFFSTSTSGDKGSPPLLSVPINLRLDSESSSLFWSEALPSFLGSNLAGSLTVRRMLLVT